MINWEKPSPFIIFLLNNPIRRIWAKLKISKLDIKPNSILIDFGCGTGIITKYLAEKVKPNGKVIAIDISEPLIQIAKKNLRNCANVEIKLAEIWELNLASESIDEIFIYYVLHEMPKEKRYKAVLEFPRTLKKDGKIRLFEPKPPHGISLEEVESIFCEAGLKCEELQIGWFDFSAVYGKD